LRGGKVSIPVKRLAEERKEDDQGVGKGKRRAEVAGEGGCRRVVHTSKIRFWDEE
jgi:hypothetical protein